MELKSDVFGRLSWDGGNQIYEGQIKRKTNGGWLAEGFGINYNKEKHQYIIGRWVNDKRHGRFYVVENKKWYKQYWDNGVRQTYGFASEEEDDKLDIYISSLFSSSDISSIND